MDTKSAWKRTCSVLLGQEAGELPEFEQYLQLVTEKTRKVRSCLSGREVYAPEFNFPSCARFISADEIPSFEKKLSAMPLSINEIKDFDSLVSAMSERVCYSGNVVLGNSGSVERSSRCMNVWFATGCADVYDSKFAAFCSDLRYVEFMFGCSIGSESSFCIHSMEMFRVQRCMETLRTYTSRDCYYTASCDDCHDCMFCFNLKDRKSSIGNIELPKEKYAQMKGKLVSEMLDDMRKKKSVRTIIDIINGD